jgi:hypothetical protein
MDLRLPGFNLFQQASEKLQHFGLSRGEGVLEHAQHFDCTVNAAQDFIFEVPLCRSELDFFLNNTLRYKLKTMTQMMIIFCEFAAHTHLNIGGKIVAAAGVHDGNSDFEDEEPDNDDKKDGAENVRTEDEPENEDDEKGQKRENTSHSVLEHVDADTVAEHFGSF